MSTDDRPHAGTDVPHVLLAASTPPLCRLGQSDEATAGAPARRARPLPELGLGRRGVAGRLARSRARSPGAPRQPVVAPRPLHPGALHLPPRPARPPAAPRP